MKKIAFTCSKCGVLNIPRAKDTWKGFNPCKNCDSIQAVTSRGEGRTLPQFYREFSDDVGLGVSSIFELQKRGILPRDLADCTSMHIDIACAVNLALGSKELLRVALSRFPIKHRAQLLHVVNVDALLTRWQRHVLEHFIKEYRQDLRDGVSVPTSGKGKRYGSVVTSISDMILYLEQHYGLSAATSRSHIKKLKKLAYNRVRRELSLPQPPEGGPENV